MAPWELMEQPSIWTAWALAAEDGEAEVKAHFQERAARKQQRQAM